MKRAFSLYFCWLSRSGTMLEGYSPVTQALLGTLFTWGLTAAGAALVFVFSSRQVIQREQTDTKKPQGFNARANALKKYLSRIKPVYLATVAGRGTASVFTMKVRQQLVSTE